jgi:integrase
MPKLTKRFVESVKPDAKAVVVFDDGKPGIPGFGLRVLPSGVRSYFLQYRNKEGRLRWFTIGKHGKVTVDEARKKAGQIHAAVASGKDPSGEKLAYLHAPTVGDLLDRYLTEHVQKRNRPTTRAEVGRLVAKCIRPHLGRLKVSAVTRQDMVRMHRALAETPRQANFVLSICSKAFKLAEVWGMRPEGTNPATKIERNRENHRERFLSADELGRLGKTLRLAVTEGLPWRVDETKPGAKHLAKPHNRRTIVPRVTGAAIELLLYTGCRLSEVLGMRWSQVDFDQGIITLPETKAGKPQVVVMNGQAQQVLRSLAAMRANSTAKLEDLSWVFPRRNDPNRPLSKDNLEAAWQRLRAAANLPDVRLHDLRHTVGTYAGQSGANAFLVRDLLRHKDLAITGRYVNRADNPVRTLSAQVGERIAAGLAGKPLAAVVPIKRGA